VELASALANHRLLDRLIRSRAWIGVIAFALIGIVAMQLWVLELNGGIGRALVHESSLQREIATLSATDAEQMAGDRVERLAAADEGMTMAPPGALRFLAVRGGRDARAAAAALGRSSAQTPPTSSASQTPVGEATGASPAPATEGTGASAAPAGEATGASRAPATEGRGASAAPAGEATGASPAPATETAGG
jgi:hypothetical protein